jgi:hypothetical protein
MKTVHVLMLSGAILGAAWILKPAPVEQVSQVELQRREKDIRMLERAIEDVQRGNCAAAAGKTWETLDRNDPKQEAIFYKCMWPEDSRGRMRLWWDKMWGR